MVFEGLASTRGAPRQHHGSPLGPPWDYRGRRTRPFGRPPLKNTVKTNGFRRFCKCQGNAMPAPWEPLGSTLGAPCELPSLLGAAWELPGSLLGGPRDTLGALSEHLGRSRAVWKPSGNRLGSILETRWQHSDTTFDHQETPEPASMIICSPADQKP